MRTYKKAREIIIAEDTDEDVIEAAVPEAMIKMIMENIETYG